MFKLLSLILSVLLVTACQQHSSSISLVEASRPSPSVIGGHPAEIQDFSFLVNIWLNNPRDNFVDHLCGGSLIADRWVLTAAHCVIEDIAEGETRPVKANTLELYLASSKINGEGGRKIAVERVIVHPKFSWPKNDVALLKLKTPILDISPIALSNIDYETFLLGQKATVMGWGLTDFNGNIDGIYLQKASVPLLSREACSNDEFPLKRGWLIEKDMICASTQLNQIAACPGDSGGPLVVSQNSRLIQIGIVSWGTACSGKVSNSNVEGYSSIANAYQWIQSTINK